MKHKRSQRTLGRKAHHRRAMMKSLSGDLLLHRSVVTTLTRAKELRRYLEPLIAKAQGETSLHKRRQLISDLGKKEDLAELLEVADEQKDRRGGYLRISRLPAQRSDGAPTAKIEIVK